MNPRIPKVPDRVYGIAFLFINLALGTVAFHALDQQIIDLDYYAVSRKLNLLRIVLLAGITANGLAIPTLFSPLGPRLLSVGQRIRSGLARLGIANVLIAAGVAVGFTVLVHSEAGLYLTTRPARLWTFWVFANLGGYLLSVWRRELTWYRGVLFFSLALAFVHIIVVFGLRISDYPLSLGWSEVSRYYQASFFFGERLYGLDLPLSVTHPSRYMLQAIPFFFPGLGLEAHRAWEVFLWLSLTTLTAWLAARRLQLGSRWLVAAVTLWAALFMFQGAVFFHLMLCLIPLLAGFDRERYGRAMLWVILASIWAGISRINWAPMPGLLAAVLMYLEQPVSEHGVIPWRYFWRSFSYFVVGLAVALLSYWVYIALSGVAQIDQFGSSYSSALLWDRLWPNPSFPIGVVLGILLVSAPLLILIVWRIMRAPREWHGFRLLGMAAIALVFLGGGLVVSVKIGGGNNLHNMDAFMVILMVIGLYLAFDRYRPEPDSQRERPWQAPAWLVGLIVCIPVGIAAVTGRPIAQLDESRAWQVIHQIDALVAEQLQDGGEVLFMSQRQLLMFDMLDSRPALVPEYEQLFLMEMAISHNRTYLDQFYADLADKRFDLIIADPNFLVFKDEKRDPLAAENNAWVAEVSTPLLCAYDYVNIYRDLGLQVLAPREHPICEVTHAPLDD